MAPRRMDGFARPGGPAQQRPMPAQGKPQPRPASPHPRQQQPVAQSGQRMADPRMASQAYGRQQMSATQQRPAKVRKKGGAWKVVLQFILGLLVIAGVAAAIVALYVRYYQ